MVRQIARYIPAQQAARLEFGIGQLVTEVAYGCAGFAAVKLAPVDGSRTAGRVAAAAFIERARCGAGVAAADRGGDRASLAVARAGRELNLRDHGLPWFGFRVQH